MTDQLGPQIDGLDMSLFRSLVESTCHDMDPDLRTGLDMSLYTSLAGILGVGLYDNLWNNLELNPSMNL